MNEVFNVKRVQELVVNIDDMSIKQCLEPGIVKVIVLDGNTGNASVSRAVNHGETIIQTVNGSAKFIHFRESEKI